MPDMIDTATGKLEVDYNKLNNPAEESAVKHATLDEFVKAGVHTIVRQAADELTEPKNVAVATKAIQQNAATAAKQATTPEARETARTGAYEAIVGSYDAARYKIMEMMQRVVKDPVAVIAVAAAGSWLLIFIAGLTLAVWRYALFGC